VAAAQLQRVGFFFERDSVLAPARVAHHDPRQCIEAFAAHQKALRGAEPGDVAAFLMRRELAPIGARGAAGIADHDLEIDCAVGVRQHVPASVPMRRRVEQIILARMKHGRRRFG
jgi:hypothetical protein